MNQVYEKLLYFYNIFRMIFIKNDIKMTSVSFFYIRWLFSMHCSIFFVSCI